MFVLTLLTLAVPSAHATGFESELDAQVQALRAASPEQAALVDGLAVVPTRAGYHRLAGPGLESDLAAPLLAERLLETEADPQLRQAIARVLASDCAHNFELVAGLYRLESDLDVRGILLGGMSRADERALPLLEQALVDPEPAIRLEAARALGYHEGGGELLLGVLEDEDEGVRAMAVRKLGYLNYGPGFEAVQGRLGDESALVRLQAVNALQRIDAVRAPGAVAPLAEDRDLGVRRAVARVSE